MLDDERQRLDGAPELHGVLPTADRRVDSRDFAGALTRLRELAGLSIRDLARRTGIPSATLGGYYSGRHLPSRPTETLIPILLACGVEEHDFQHWLIALTEARRNPGSRSSISGQPYRGLKHFTAEDAVWFFGRETSTHRLLELVQDIAQDPTSTAPIVVTGPSGSGKSSLLCAGLIPAYGGDHLLLSPGATPLTELARHLGGRSGCSTEAIEWQLRRDAGALPTEVRDAVPALVVVDQFEELFSSTVPAPDQATFIDSLHALSSTADGGARSVTVLGLRSDFYLEASEQPALLAALQNNQVVLGPMSEDELRRAIVEPARRAGRSVDDDLVELVLRDMASTGGRRHAHDPGSLPLMSHALMETWQRAPRGHLSRTDYLATGGVQRAAQQTAEAVYGQLNDRQQALARRVFLRLIQVGDATPITRRRVASSELLELSTADSEVPPVLALFVDNRLLTLDAGHVEISHESLLAAWPRLTAWIEKDVESLRRLRQLTALAQQWDAAGRDEDSLLRGLKLEENQRWLGSDSRWNADLNRTERDFLNASAITEQQRHTHQLRGIRRTRQLLGAVSVLAAIACLLATYAFRARSESGNAQRDALHQRDIAQSRQLAAEATDLEDTDPALASQLALASYRVAPTVEARSALLDSLATPSPSRLLGQPGPTAIAVSATDQLIAMSNAVTGSVQLFTRSGLSETPHRMGMVPGTGKETTIYSLTFQPHAQVLAVGGQDSLVRLWDVSDPGKPRLIGSPISGIQQAVETIAFSPNGRLMVVGGGGPAVWIWDVTTPSKPRLLKAIRGMPAAVQTVAFASDGRTLALGGGNGLLQRWNVASPGQPLLLRKLPDAPPPSTTIQSVAFSPDSSLLAVGSKNGTVKLWRDATTAAAAVVHAPLTTFDNWVDVVAFSPDGRTLAAGSADNSLLTWSVGTWVQDRAFPHAGPVTGIAFLADRSGVLSASADGAGHLWRLPGPALTGTKGKVFSLSVSSAGLLAVAAATRTGAMQLWAIAESPARQVAQLNAPGNLTMDGAGAISRDGRFLAGADHTGSMPLWDIADPHRPHLLVTLTGPRTVIESIAFSPDSRLLAAGGDDNAIHFWDLSDPAHPKALRALTGHTSFVLNIAFSPDGRTLASAGADKTVRLWDVGTPAVAHPLVTIKAFTGYAASVAFSPDGALLAAGSAQDNTVRLWNVHDPAQPRSLGLPLTEARNTIFGVAFSPDSRMLAAGSADRTVRLWNITDPRHATLTATLRAGGNSVFAVAFTSDGSTLAASGVGGDVNLWPASIDAAVHQSCARAGDQITTAEWATYVSDRRYEPPCH